MMRDKSQSIYAIVSGSRLKQHRVIRAEKLMFISVS